eukprot:CAMPEP_0174282522 /NCGR_PEP_ID=MMETSP0809-20121228/3046_1 /TAXON_ID=73025 ORGANISM="Eutreptiella gymnastica-like, Strain CCMP1594" /NCGR_SAMPLE_ID=MMETSP0809 /ASSEMBLY_ACC=CAM_ASM_000658 /LENGTH=80 /DNA_ID=CAMNT_0015376799 /DNA_START=90 /DNA_END=332 /DNA_ORIENTATION=-
MTFNGQPLKMPFTGEPLKRSGPDVTGLEASDFADGINVQWNAVRVSRDSPCWKKDKSSCAADPSCTWFSAKSLETCMPQA